MQAITPITPLEPSEMFHRKRTPSMFEPSMATFLQRSWQQMQQEEADMDTDFESGSEADEFSPKPSFDSDERRRSQTTISSYEEAHTPSPRNSDLARFEFNVQSTQGPKGPHLFRASQMSSDFDSYLTMSPLLVKEPETRAATAFTEATVTTRTQPSPPQYQELRSPGANLREAEAQIRSWSTQQVIDWMYSSGIEASVIESFEIHDINGAILLDLQFDDLKELDIQSYGKRHNLWEAICLLRGDESPRLHATPFQDTSRPCTVMPEQNRPHWETFTINRARSVDPATTGSKRRGRKAPRSKDIVTPAESVSIVAIEEHLPRLHRCAKGEDCPKWRKQQRQLQKMLNMDDWTNFPISPAQGGRIHVTGDPGNAHVAENLLPQCHKAPEVQPSPVESAFQASSVAIPSVVASSDLLGPGDAPAFSLQALQESALNNVAWRDPQDNVKQFLALQHMQPPNMRMQLQQEHEAPQLELFPATSVPAFPAQNVNAVSDRHAQFNALPKLSIPRSASAAPMPASAGGSCTSATMSPLGIYRLATPASETDVPVTLVSPGPVARDASQSVPPNMQYRQQKALSRAGVHDWRRPSMQLQPVQEDAVLNAPLSAVSGQALSIQETFVPRTQDPAKNKPNTQVFGYGADCTRAGWMRKRRTKMLRHEWVDAHCRLTGTQLALHKTARLATTPTDTIDVANYAVACNAVASNNKLSAAMKALSLRSDTDGKKDDPTAFAFQLVPNGKPSGAKGDGKKGAMASAAAALTLGGANGSSKTHHFAVRTKDDRIDWMRDLMLAKALQQKGDGYEVEVNGVQA